MTKLTKNGQVEAAAAAAQISSLLDSKDLKLRELAKLFQSKFDEKEVLEVMANTVSSLLNNSDSQIMRTYFHPHVGSHNTILYSTPGLTNEKEVSPKLTKNYIPIVNANINNGKEIPWTSATDYDARLTPWYANAISGPKDVVSVGTFLSLYLL